MADYPISNVPRRVQYVNTGVGPYLFNFEILTQTDIAVYRGSTLLTLTTDYTVTINSNGTGSVTLVTAGTGNITIVGARAIQRTSDYTTNGDLFANTLNTDLDSQTIYSQQIAETANRSLRVPPYVDSTTGLTVNPEANKLLGWDSTGANLVNIDAGTLATIATYATAYADVFVSNGSTTVYTLTRNPGSIYNLDVSIDGVTQEPIRDYTLSGSVITFTSTIPINARILVKYKEGLPNVTADSQDIRYLPAGSSTVTNVQAKLRETVSVKDFGAVGDGVADDTTAINNAISAVGIGGSLFFPKGTYLTTNTIDLRRRFVQATEATISGNHTNIIVIAGGNSVLGNNPSQWIGTVSRVGGVTTTPDVRIMGAKGQHIGVQRAEYLQIYADTDDATTTSCAYSSFWFKYVNKLELTANFATTGSSVQWINENEFFLNRTNEFIMDGTYAHNNNRFYGGTFENASITINTGWSNTFNNVRFEGTNAVTFGANANYNTIIQTFISSSAPWNTETVTATVTDSGYGNTVVRQESINRVTHIVGSASAADVVLNNAVNFSGRTPSLAVVRGGSSQGDIFITDFVRVYKNDSVGFFTSAQGSTNPLYRIAVYFYDIDKKPVTPVLNTNFVSSSITNIVSNYVANTTGQTQAVLGLISNSVAYVKIYIHGSSGGQASSQLANDISAFVRRPNNFSPLARHNAAPYSTFINSSPYAVTAAPTQGYAPLGYEAVNTNGLVRYVVTRSIDTALTNAASGGATSIVVDNATGVTNGDIVGVLNDDIYITNWTTVSSVSGTTIGLTAGLTGACAAGNRVVFMRWTTITY